MHEVVADVVEELLGAAGAGAGAPAGAAAAPASEGAAAADAWLLVSELGAQPYRDNSVGAQLMKLRRTSTSLSSLCFSSKLCSACRLLNAWLQYRSLGRSRVATTPPVHTCCFDFTIPICLESNNHRSPTCYRRLLLFSKKGVDSRARSVSVTINVDSSLK